MSFNSTIGPGGTTLTNNPAFIASDRLAYPYTYDEWLRCVGKIWPPQDLFTRSFDIDRATCAQNFTECPYRLIWYKPPNNLSPVQLVNTEPFDITRLDGCGGSFGMIHDPAVTLYFEYISQQQGHQGMLDKSGPKKSIKMWSTNSLDLPDGSGVVTLRRVTDNSDVVQPLLDANSSLSPGVINIQTHENIYKVRVKVTRNGKELHKPITISGGMDAVLRYDTFYYCGIVSVDIPTNTIVGRLENLVRVGPGQTALIVKSADRASVELRVVQTRKYLPRGYRDEADGSWYTSQ